MAAWQCWQWCTGLFRTDTVAATASVDRACSPVAIAIAAAAAAAAVPPGPEFHRFLQLPPEIRLLIYRCYLLDGAHTQHIHNELHRNGRSTIRRIACIPTADESHFSASTSLATLHLYHAGGGASWRCGHIGCHRRMRLAQDGNTDLWLPSPMSLFLTSRTVYREARSVCYGSTVVFDSALSLQQTINSYRLWPATLRTFNRIVLRCLIPCPSRQSGHPAAGLSLVHDSVHGYFPHRCTSPHPPSCAQLIDELDITLATLSASRKMDNFSLVLVAGLTAEQDVAHQALAILQHTSFFPYPALLHPRPRPPLPETITTRQSPSSPSAVTAPAPATDAQPGEPADETRFRLANLEIVGCLVDDERTVPLGPDCAGNRVRLITRPDSDWVRRLRSDLASRRALDPSCARAEKPFDQLIAALLA